MKVKSESEVSQSCLTLSDPMDCSLPGSSTHEILQARVLERVAIAFSIEVFTIFLKSIYLFNLNTNLSRHIPLFSSFYRGRKFDLEGILGFFREIKEKEMSPHSSTLAWKIPWMEEPARLQSMGSLRVRHD